MTEGRQRKKPRNKNEVQRFWNFVPDEESNTAEMLLYGEISEYSWYGDEITPSVFNQELKDLGAVDEITVRINSGGGDVFAAVAIYTRLKEHKAKISVKIDGWCASAATIIAMAGDTIEISVGGVFMIHDPLAGLIGYYNTTDLENIVKELETIKQSIVNCYMTVTDKSEEEIKSLMTNEGEWFTGEEAVEAAENAEEGEEVVYYLTGEFFGSAIEVPVGKTAADFKAPFRKIGIFLVDTDNATA